MSRERKVLRYPVGRDARQRLRSGELEPCLALFEPYGVETRDWIDTARREKDERRVVVPRQLKTVVSAEQGRANQVVEAALDARNHRWLCRAFNERIKPARVVEVRAISHVTMYESHAGAAKPLEAELRPPTSQVVKRGDAPVGMPCGESDRDVRADEART